MDAIMPNYSIIFQALIFFAALFIVKTFIINPITTVLKGRGERIEGAEQEAARLDRESSDLDGSYRSRIREARAEAQMERARHKKEAQDEERKILEKGREEANKNLQAIQKEIRKESEEATARLKQDAEQLSQILAEKLLGRSVS